MAEPRKAIEAMSTTEVQAELNDLMRIHGWRRPSRSAPKSDRPWLHGIPNYDKADLLYFRGRSTVHKEGSLEAVVEDAVKTWEMEASHLPYTAWQSVQHNVYSVVANGGKRFTGEEAARAGNYNWLMANVDKSLYDAEHETFGSSHGLFRGAFLDGFPWEVLKVFSGPPKVAFSWRHWATFNGTYRGRQGDGKTYDLYGFGVLDLSEELKVREIQIFYEPEDFLRAMQGDVSPESLQQARSVMGPGCPFLNGGRLAQSPKACEAARL